MFDAILIRYGELFLKKGNRNLFINRLRENLRQKTLGLDHVNLTGVHGRFILESTIPMDEERAATLSKAMASTFGLVSVSPAAVCASEREVIEERAMQLAESWLARNHAATFKVACSRSYKALPFNSMELNRSLGAKVATRFNLAVKMTEPHLVISLEVHRDRTFIFLDTMAAPGGLPVGSSGRAIVLLSGGIDSPVAAYMMAKRGCALDALYFHSYPYTSDAARDKVLALARRVAYYHGPMTVHTAPFTPIQEYLRDMIPAEYLVLAYRRSMMRIATALAGRRKAGALVTGESLGQVASQTMENMGAVEEASGLPVLRPLVGFDKEETVIIARKIGTFELSILPADDCCQLFAPTHPATKSKAQILRQIEAHLPQLSSLENIALDNLVTETVS
jgi:thiamine biosynthesis protein ThiI